MPTTMTWKERPFSESELAGLGKEQARLLQDIGQLVVQEKVSTDGFKAAIGEKQKQVEEIAKRINSGFERQDVKCDVLLNTPARVQKTLVDISSGQIVRVEEMTEADQQSRLFEEDERPDNNEPDEDASSPD